MTDPPPTSPAPATLPDLPAPRRPVPRSSLWGWIVPLPPPGRRGLLAILRWLLSRIFLGFVLICLMLALLQRTLIYHRSQAERIAAAEEPVPAGMLHDVTVTSTVGTLH